MTTGQRHSRQGRPAVGGRRHHQIETSNRGHPLSDCAYQLEALGIEIDQHDFGPLEILAVFDQGGHCAGGSRGAATQVDELDPRHSLTRL